MRKGMQRPGERGTEKKNEPKRKKGENN